MDSTRKKRVTLHDIAQLSGVSKTTVSMILNGHGGAYRIHPETCRRVKQIAQAQGYRANTYARALKTQRSNVIGLVIPDLTNYGFALTAKTLEKLCRENGLQLVIACSDDNPVQEKMAIDRLLDRQIDLLITAPTHQDPKYYRSIVKHTMLLHLDRYVPNLDICHIISNDSGKIAELVANLIQKANPNEFYYLGGQLELSPSESRLAGFRQGLAQAGLTAQPEWILHQDYQPESGYKMLSNIVAKLGRLPQAIFTASYTLLEGVLRYLSEQKQMDKLLTGELLLATFDDHQLLNALPFPIHSIKQDHEQIAHRTFEQIRQKLRHNTAENVQVECEIIWR